MPTVPIFNAWHDTVNAYLAVEVNEGRTASDGSPILVHYIGSVPLQALSGLTSAQIKAALVAAVKAVRDQSLALSQPPVQTSLGITGQITI